MGCCESCASSRKRDAARRLQTRLATKCSADELRAAIVDAEGFGPESLPTRQRYCELAKQERQSAANLEEMLDCAVKLQDGPMLYAVLTEAKQMDLETQTQPAFINLCGRARHLLAELQDETMKKLWRMSQWADAATFSSQLDHAKRIGIAPSELGWARKRLVSLRQANMSDSEVIVVDETGRRKSAPA